MSLPTPALAADAPAWGGWAELGGTAGEDAATRGEVAVFVPLAQDGRGLFFADMRGKLFQDDINEANFAVGYRQMLESGWNAGGWFGGDRRNTAHGNVFWGLAGGVEMLSDRFDARLNGYLALSDPATSPRNAAARIEAGQVFIDGSEEVPLSGADAELGVRVPLGFLGIDPARRALRVYAGGFYFDDGEALEEVAGPKARAAFRVDDAIAALPGSRLVLETAWRSDDVRGSHVEAGARFSLPFATFIGGAARMSDRPVQWRRMTDAIRRDTDIVTVAGKPEAVEDALTGVDFDRAVDVNGATGVTGPAAAAGGNTLLVADGSAGVFTGPQTLQANQTLLGGAGTIQVRGLRTGTVVNLTAPGQRPTFSNTLNSTNVLLADRTHFAAAAVTGNTANLLNNGLGFVSDQFVVVQDVDISNVGGVGVLAVDRNTARLIDVSVSNAPNGPAVALRNGNAVTIEGSRLDRAGFGLLFNNQNTVNVTGTSITNSTIDGINVNSGNALTVAGTTISGTGIDGIAFNNGNTISVSDTTLANIGVDAVFGINNNVVMLANVSAAGAGQDFVDVNDFNTVTVSNSTATGLGGRAFLIDDANTLTVSGGQYSSAAEGIDADDGNAIALTDTSIASNAGQEGVDISDGNTFVMLRSTVSSAGNRVLEFSNNNNVTVNLSMLTGTPTNTVAYEGAGNVLSGTGNVDASAPTVGFCFDAGGQTGTVGFTNGTTCP